MSSEAPAIAEINALVQQGKFAEALPLLEATLRRQPVQGDMLWMLAHVTAQLGQPEHASKLLDEIAPAAGEHALFLAYHAQALDTAGRFYESLAKYERAL